MKNGASIAHRTPNFQKNGVAGSVVEPTSHCYCVKCTRYQPDPRNTTDRPRRKALDSSPAPDNTKLATPSSTSQAGLNALSNRNPRTTTNPIKAAHTKTKISNTHAPKQPPNPAKAQIPFLNSVISLSNPAATEIKFLAEKYQANFNNIGDLETHEFRSMSRLLWLTHLELKDRLREVQGLEREVQGLKREREDWRRERKNIMRALGRMSEIGGNSPAGSAEGDDEIATQEK